ncbi:MAG: hypothetical protein GY847_27255 [Proteobacteria bacterium]|nr:hypothetical protein [Pseudomonadota bacterium]
MNKLAFAITALLTAYPAGSLAAEDFLGVPVTKAAEVVKKTEGRMEFKTALSHDDTVEFYKNAVKDFKDIKTIEREEYTQITDYGNLKWHSIKVFKTQHENKIIVHITKDNWKWIIGTLVLRYIGVFMVIIALFICMSVSGLVISKSLSRIEAGQPTASTLQESKPDAENSREQEMIAVSLAAIREFESRKKGEV